MQKWSCFHWAQVVQQAFKGKVVTEGPKAAHHTNSTISQIGMMTKRLTRMGVAQVELHVRDGHSEQGIPQRNGCMGEGTGIDQDAVDRAHRLVDPLHKGTLKIALVTIQLHTGSSGTLFQVLLNRIQRLVPIETRLPLPKQIEIGAIEQQQLHRPWKRCESIVSSGVSVMDW